MVYMHAVFAAFHMLSFVKILLKGEVEGGALNSHEITLLIMENHRFVFLNFCGNPGFMSS